MKTKDKTGARDFSLRLTPTFLDGVLLAGNAVEDAAVIYSGATCIDERARQALINHDYGQTLLRPGPRTRLVTTFADYSIASMGTASIIEDVARGVLRTGQVKLLILAELSRITLAGEDLKGLAASLPASIPIIAAGSRSLRRDYSDAFSSILCGLAAALPESAFTPRPGVAAVIGYFFERHEGDQAGNLRVLDAMLRALGQRPAPAWLSGCRRNELAAAGKASVLLALPDGLAAAKVLAARGGARVLPIELPIGLDGTCRWLRQVGAALGREAPAERFIKTRLAEVVPRLDWLASRLAGRRAALYAAPEWLSGLAESFEQDLGLEVAVRRPRRRADGSGSLIDENDPGRVFDPSVATLSADLAKAGALDFAVGSSWESHAASTIPGGPPWVEFGYPSLRRHFLRSAPHLGLEGVLTWAERLAAEGRAP